MLHTSPRVLPPLAITLGIFPTALLAPSPAQLDHPSYCMTIWQRIKELGVDPDVLGYVWDGGSSQEYDENVSVVSDADSSRAQTDPKFALTTLSQNRLGSSTLDSPGSRYCMCSQRLPCSSVITDILDCAMSNPPHQQRAQGMAICGQQSAADRRRAAHALGGFFLGLEAQVLAVLLLVLAVLNRSCVCFAVSFACKASQR